MQDLDVGLLGTAAAEPRQPTAAGAVARGRRRPGTSTSATARAAATRCGPGTAGRSCRTPPLREQPDARRDGCPWPTPPTSSAGSFPTAARTSRWPPPSRSAACSALSQLSIVSALLRFRREQFGAGRVREILDRVTPFALPELLAERVDLGRFVALSRARWAGRRPRGRMLRAAPARGRSRPRARACAASSTRSSPAASGSTSTRCARPATPSASSPRSPRPTSRSPR